MKKRIFMVVIALVLCFAFVSTASAAGYYWADNFPQVSTTQNSTHITVANAQVVARACTGTAITIDSNFGPATKACVQDFQRRYNLADDGIVGSDTWFIMNGRLQEYPVRQTGYFKIKYNKENALTDNNREYRSSSTYRWESYSPTLGWIYSSY
jgi:hypothetical protein